MKAFLLMLAIAAFIPVIVCVAKAPRGGEVGSFGTACKRFTACIVSFAKYVLFLCVCFLTFFGDISGILKNGLSVDFISSLKLLFRLFFGTGSVFTALQLMAVFSFMLGLVSCAMLAAGWIVCAVFCIRACFMRAAEASGCRTGSRRENYRGVKAFLIYSRYNS